MPTPHDQPANVLVLQHLSDDGPGYLGQWLDFQKISWHVFCADAGETYPASLSAYNGMAVLGGEWGSDTPLDLGNNREAAAALHGRWVMEFSEMESVTRAEAHLQKSFLSRTFDQYRPVYSRRNIKVPRQCVFIGTTNETEYIKEGQGARRFWPITVGRATGASACSCRP
jgi:hypothetical protein